MHCLRRGCEIFGGNTQLKTLLQWISSSGCRRDMYFMGFNDKRLAGMERKLSDIGKRFPTTKDLFDAIVRCIEQTGGRPSREWSLWDSLLQLEPTTSH